jgi:hypothetical protein
VSRRDLSIWPFAIVGVFLVERPADALRNITLDLPLDIRGVGGTADITGPNKAHDRHLAGLGIDLDIAELRQEARCHAFLAAISLNDIGWKSPTQGRTRSQTTLLLSCSSRPHSTVASCQSTSYLPESQNHPLRRAAEREKQREIMRVKYPAIVLGVALTILGMKALAAGAWAAASTPILGCPYTITAPGNYILAKNLTSSGSCIAIQPLTWRSTCKATRSRQQNGVWDHGCTV